MTIVGEICGGIIMYIIVEKLRLFNDKPECEFDKAIYCPNYQF